MKSKASCWMVRCLPQCVCAYGCRILCATWAETIKVKKRGKRWRRRKGKDTRVSTCSSSQPNEHQLISSLECETTKHQASSQVPVLGWQQDLHITATTVSSIATIACNEDTKHTTSKEMENWSKLNGSKEGTRALCLNFGCCRWTKQTTTTTKKEGKKKRQWKHWISPSQAQSPQETHDSWGSEVGLVWLSQKWAKVRRGPRCTTTQQTANSLSSAAPSSCAKNANKLVSNNEQPDQYRQGQHNQRGHGKRLTMRREGGETQRQRWKKKKAKRGSKVATNPLTHPSRTCRQKRQKKKKQWCVQHPVRLAPTTQQATPCWPLRHSFDAAPNLSSNVVQPTTKNKAYRGAHVWSKPDASHDTSWMVPSSHCGQSRAHCGSCTPL